MKPSGKYSGKITCEVITMTIENVNEILVDEMTENQCHSMSEKDDYLYAIAFNDGLIQMANKIKEILREEEVVPE